jgi:hypothetical protein
VANNIRSINSHRLADLAVLLLLAGLVTVYCVDAIRASTEILNLILVVPVAVAILALCLAQFVLGVSKLRAEEEPKEPVSDVVPITLLFAVAMARVRCRHKSIYRSVPVVARRAALAMGAGLLNQFCVCARVLLLQRTALPDADANPEYYLVGRP